VGTCYWICEPDSAAGGAAMVSPAHFCRSAAASAPTSAHHPPYTRKVCSVDSWPISRASVADRHARLERPLRERVPEVVRRARLKARRFERRRPDLAAELVPADRARVDVEHAARGERARSGSDSSDSTVGYVHRPPREFGLRAGQLDGRAVDVPMLNRDNFRRWSRPRRTLGFSNSWLVSADTVRILPDKPPELGPRGERLRAFVERNPDLLIRASR
jgi:hypothetical protein